jgi:TM2 domain-containing membrane protein YozV
MAAKSKTSKSKVVAALCCFFLGLLGVHRFYLGYTTIGIVQLALTFVAFLTFILGVGILVLGGVSIWTFIEFILILIGKLNDSKGNKLI